jgi:hypothetical protein
LFTAKTATNILIKEGKIFHVSKIFTFEIEEIE